MRRQSTAKNQEKQTLSLHLGVLKNFNKSLCKNMKKQMKEVQIMFYNCGFIFINLMVWTAMTTNPEKSIGLLYGYIVYFIVQIALRIWIEYGK